VSRYYEAIKLIEPDDELENYREDAAAPVRKAAVGSAVVPMPLVRGVTTAVARTEEIQHLCERLAPIAVVDKSMRLAISGCRPGDGASTISAGLALDLSQRLGLRTMLIDAHLRYPSLHRLFAGSGSGTHELVLDGALQIRTTGWSRLELASCCLVGGDEDRDEVLSQFENLLGNYPAVVVDLGVTRLDSRMLPLVRPTDPILLVTRYGQTKRQELASAAAGLRAANRALAGVIFNAAANPVANTTKKLSKQETE
jgi:receptor protein-tyrosine kinase